MELSDKTLYLCDPEKHKECKKGPCCHMNGGPCKHTFRKEYQRTMKIKLDAGAYVPERAHSTDAGLDLRAKEGKTIFPRSSETFSTGVHVKLPHGTAGVLISKSGLNVNHGITSTGLIDEGYDGEIKVKLYNNGERLYRVNAGDKISQLVVVPVLYEPVELVEDLEQASERGSDGFGSTGVR